MSPSAAAASGGGTPVGHRSDAQRRLWVGIELHESIPANPRLHAVGLPRLSAAKTSWWSAHVRSCRRLTDSRPTV